MQQLRVRSRWLVLSAAVVALILALAVASGAARGSTSGAAARENSFGGQAGAARGQFGFGGQPGQSVRRGGQAGNVDPAVVAQTLHISVAQLQRELGGGKTLSQVITEHGATADQVVNALVAQQKAQLDQEVAGGRMSRAQEQALLAASTGQFRDAITNNALTLGGTR